MLMDSNEEEFIQLYTKSLITNFLFKLNFKSVYLIWYIGYEASNFTL